MSTDSLLESFTLKNLELNNRIVSTSHATAYAEDAMPKDRYLRYHLEKAKGGVGLTMMGGASCVAPESPAFVNNIALYRDEVVPHLRRLSDAVHEHGTKVMIQVTHAGRRTTSYVADWLPIISASDVRERQHKAWPKVAEDWDIERAIAAFADGVERCKAGGLDGVELLGVGHLLDQFWSPATNHRDDDWGGDFERRLKFPIAVLRAVRERVGSEFVVGARIAVDEHLQDGLKFDQGIELIRRLTDEGLDFVSVVEGGYDSDARLGGVIPPMGTPFAPSLEFAGQVKQRIEIPVMHAARIRDLDVARDAITEGKLDLVGMVRPLIADPHLVKRIRNNTLDRARPTVGSGYTIDRIYVGGDMVDIGNAATGRESTLPHVVPPADVRKRAVVVGAGIAGLEAARTLAERAHDVTVLERDREAGGQVRLASLVQRRAEIGQLIDWRLRELEVLGATVRYGVEATPDVVLAMNPNVVVVATGGTPRTATEGLDDGLLTDPWAILTGERHLSGDVLFYDDLGDHESLAVAEALVDGGSALEIVTPERTLGLHLGATNYPPYYKKFAEHDVSTTLNYRMTGLERTAEGRLRVSFDNEFGAVSFERIVDHVVNVAGTRPNDELYFQLKPMSVNGGAVDQEALIALEPQTTVRNAGGSFQLFRVGDAVSSRNIPAAVVESYRLCLAI